MGSTMKGKVLLFCGGVVFYGKEIVTLSLAEGLRHAGWDVGFITSYWNSTEVTARLQSSKIPCHFLWLGFVSATLRLEPIKCTIGQLQKLIRLWSGFRRIARSNDVRVIIHTNWHHAMLLLPMLDPKRDIFWVHDSLPENARYVSVIRAIAQRVGRVICVSNAVARSYEAAGIPTSKIQVIYNGVDISGREFSRGTAPELRVGIVGQIGDWKGYDDLIDALDLLKKKGVAFKLFVFGSGSAEYVDALKSRIRRLSLESLVEWCGFVADRDKIYEAIDLCVLPSRVQESLSTAAIEASAAGLPVVCSDRGGFPEIVEDNVTGFVVEAGRADRLAEAIGKFISSPSLLRSMGQAGRQRAVQLFSHSRFVDEFSRSISSL